MFNWWITLPISGTSFRSVMIATASLVQSSTSEVLWSAQQIPKIFFGNPSQTSLIVAAIGDVFSKTDSPIRCQTRRPWANLHLGLQKDRRKATPSMSKTVEKARSAETGRFIPMEEAIKHPKTTVVEKVKVGPTKHRK